MLEEAGGPAFRLARELGISGEIQPVRDKANYIARDGRLFSMPAQLLRVLSVSGALRAARGFVVPSSAYEDNRSVGGWAARRFGSEFAQRIIDPIVCGIYAGDPERLSLDATFPLIRELEHAHRSMLIAALKCKPVKRTVYTFRNGMQTLTSGLAQHIGPALRTSCTVSSVTLVGGLDTGLKATASPYKRGG